MDRLLPTDPENIGGWELTGRIASSSYSIIYLGKKGVEGAQEAAVKVLSEEFSSDTAAIKRLRKEVEILRKIDNPHIAKLLDYDLETKPAYIAIEYLNRKNLDVKLRQDGVPITETPWWRLACYIFDGLKAIHSVGVIHKDIKPANIMIDGDIVKIIDFGISHISGQTEISSSTMHFEGSRLFAAPENFQYEPSEKMDVFSAAVTLAYAGRLKSIWNTESESTLSNSINKGIPDLEGLSPEQIEFLLPLLDKFKSKRPSSEDALKNARDYLAYFLDKKNPKPNPLKGSSWIYKLIRKKPFQIIATSAAVLTLFSVLLLRPSPTIIGDTPDSPSESINQKKENSAPEVNTNINTDVKLTLDCENAITARDNYYDKCLDSAKKGNMRAIYFLGEDRYAQNLFKEAEKWYLLNANKGDYSSMYGLVKTYEELGDNVLRTKWLKQCANAFYGINEYSPKDILGRCKLIYGLDIKDEGQDKQALLYFRDAVNYGNSDAAVILGMTYRDLGDKTAAKKWFMVGAELGNDQAISELVVALNEDRNINELIDILTISANKKNLRSMYELAKQYARSEEYDKAKKWSLNCSDLPECAHIYGAILYYQDKNLNLGKKYITKAANQGYTPSINELGRIFGTDKDFVNAEKVLQKSANKGDYRGSTLLLDVLLQQTKIRDACELGLKIKIIAKEASVKSTWTKDDQEQLEITDNFLNEVCLKK